MRGGFSAKDGYRARQSQATLISIFYSLQGDPILSRLFGFAFDIEFDIPNDIPVLGQMSDLMLTLLACRWFINSCPAELVASHVAAIRGRIHVPALGS